MACVIAAPASGSGKTLLSLCLIAWARQLGHSIQPFKVGPDYLDPQLLSLAATPNDDDGSESTLYRPRNYPRIETNPESIPNRL